MHRDEQEGASSTSSPSTRPPSPPPAGPAYQTCTVVYSVFERPAEQLQLSYSHEVSVAGVKECGFICYQSGCSGALFEPRSLGAVCRMAFGQRENCRGVDRRDFHHRAGQSVGLSCFRCCEWGARGPNLLLSPSTGRRGRRQQRGAATARGVGPAHDHAEAGDGAQQPRRQRQPLRGRRAGLE